MVVMSPLAHDGRVRREAGALAGAGHTVTVVGRGPVGEPLAGVDMISVGADASRAGERRPSRLRNAARYVAQPERLHMIERKFGDAVGEAVAGQVFDVYHAHDLPTLPLVTNLAAGRPVVYDAHECWVGRKRTWRPTPLGDRRALAEERRLAASTAAVITVSPGLATWFATEHGIDDAVVVRNTSPAEPERAEPGSIGYVAYAGNVTGGRDLETVVAGAGRAGVDVRFMGSRMSDAPAVVTAVAPPAAPREVSQFLRGGGLAVVPLEDSCLNHRLALPNKLFHAIAAGVPVIASELPELGAFVREWDVGTTYHPGDTDSFAAAVDRMRTRHAHHVAAVEHARRSIDWSADAAALLDVYKRLGM